MAQPDTTVHTSVTVSNGQLKLYKIALSSSDSFTQHVWWFVVAKPLTWADMASRNAGGSSASLTSASSAVRQQTVPDVSQTPRTAW